MFSSTIRSNLHLDTEKRSTLVFTILTRLLALILLIAGTFEFIPAWILRDPIDEAHLWHIAELTALSVTLLGIVIFALSFRPSTKPLLAQFVVLGTTTLAIGLAPFNIGGAALLLVAGLVLLLYPNRRALLSLRPEGSLSIPFLVITFLFAWLLIPLAQKEVYWQIIGMVSGDSHSTFLHWIGSALLYILLIQAGVLAATKRPGWKALAIGTGITYCYLGFTAMITPFYAGSWGITGGLFTIFGGVLYMLFTLVEAESIRLKQEAALARKAADDESLPARDIAPVKDFAFSSQAIVEKHDERVEVYQ